MESYRILLAEDHVIFREAIKKGLTETPGIKVVGEVGDGAELLQAIEQLSPQLILLDLGMPHLSGLEAATKIKQLYPEIKILVLTMYNSKEHLFRAFAAKVDGYLLKENAFSDLLTAIETIRKGRMYISELVTQQFLGSFGTKSWVAPPGSQPLSPRQIEVLKYLAEGKSNREIGELLLISELTVRAHLGHIKKKLHINSNVELARYALKQGYASLT
jgi:DNA-binding NarL/FixJ family response regulator